MCYTKTLYRAKSKPTRYFNLMLVQIANMNIPFTNDSTFDNGSLNLSPVTRYLSQSFFHLSPL